MLFEMCVAFIPLLVLIGACFYLSYRNEELYKMMDEKIENYDNKLDKVMPDLVNDIANKKLGDKKIPEMVSEAVKKYADEKLKVIRAEITKLDKSYTEMLAGKVADETKPIAERLEKLKNSCSETDKHLKAYAKNINTTYSELREVKQQMATVEEILNEKGIIELVTKELMKKLADELGAETNESFNGYRELQEEPKKKRGRKPKEDKNEKKD